VFGGAGQIGADRGEVAGTGPGYAGSRRPSPATALELRPMRGLVVAVPNKKPQLL
jgi:hypothetical protein